MENVDTAPGQEKQTIPTTPSETPQPPIDLAQESPKTTRWPTILTVVIGVLILGTASYFVYQKYQPEDEPKQPEQSVPQASTPTTTEPTVPAESPVTTLETYTSEKFGFSLQYPRELEITAAEYDLQADQREYNIMCSAEEAECGGGRWPDYQIRFYNTDNLPVFTVDIHVIPMAEYFGGKEHNGFTFSVRKIYQIYDFTNHKPGDPYLTKDITKNVADARITEKLITQIESSLTFTKPTKPLSCLWTPEFVGVDVTKPGINPALYEEASGYLYNSEIKSCEEFSIYVSERARSNIPFQSLAECLSACTRQ